MGLRLVKQHEIRGYSSHRYVSPAQHLGSSCCTLTDRILGPQRPDWAKFNAMSLRIRRKLLSNHLLWSLLKWTQCLSIGFTFVKQSLGLRLVKQHDYRDCCAHRDLSRPPSEPTECSTTLDQERWTLCL